MLSNTHILLIVAALIIIGALSVYAGYLLNKLKQQKRQHAEQQQAQLVALQSHDKKVLNSAEIITKAMQAEQCDFAEGSWRLCVLLDSLKASTAHNEKFPAIFELYDTIKHLSILEKRKALPKQQRMKEDLIRAKAEAKLTPVITKELTLLLQHIASLNKDLSAVH